MTPGRRGRAALTLGVLALAAVVACSSTNEEPPGEPPRSDVAPPTPTAEPTAPSSAIPRPTRVTIAVAGDIHFEGVLRDRLDDPATALAPATAALAAADVAIVNLETSVGRGGSPDPSKRYTFQAPPSAFTALAEAGVDVASM